jgi:hypothetical protein
MKTLISLLICFIITSPLLAQQSITPRLQLDINIQRKVINDKRNTALAFNMSFTQQEKEKFWPVYREYRVAMGKVGDKRVAVIVDYATYMDSMTQSMAKQLLDRSFAVEKETIKVKERYVRKFRKFLPETKVVRLMQVENRMDSMIDLKLAEGIPLME